LDILEALYFFLQSVEANDSRLQRIRETFVTAPRGIRSNLLSELQNEIKNIRRESGAIAPNRYFLDLLSEFRSKTAEGQVYIPKWVIEREWFSNYVRLMARWPYMKDHAMVVFDPKN
jgi:hypothetical protein